MSMQLAELLCYASGFAVEPYEIINIIEQAGGINPALHQIVSSGVDIFQIESRNPHLHEEKGDEHVKQMLLSSLSAIYYSPICPNNIKDSIIETCKSQGLEMEKELVKIKPPLEVNFNNFIEALKQKSQTLTELK